MKNVSPNRLPETLPPLQNISNIYDLEKALNSSHERFSLIIKAISECIWDWDMETGQIYRTESLATLTGYTLDEMQKGLTWWYGKVHQRDRVRVKDKVKDCLDKGHEHWQDEYRFRCADNSYKYFIDKGVILYRDKKPVRAIGVIQDITEKKQLEAKLLKQGIKKQKEISQAMIAAQDRERNELSKELHDNINQILTTVGLLLDYVKDGEDEEKEALMEKSRQYVKLAIEEIRKVSKSLNTSIVQEAGLLKPVQEIICNLKLSHRFTVNFDYDPALEHTLSAELKLMIYRIIQEQTNNIVKHAKATEVSVSIKQKANLLYLFIYDNGLGFDLKIPRKGIGLTNMRTRVDTFNGSMQIITTPGRGCHIKIVVPLCKV
jgi:PAS domain S-box-containing protein